jgi:hypothetical protein
MLNRGVKSLSEDPVDINIFRAYCFWHQETKSNLVGSLDNCEDTVTRVILL